MVVSEKKWAVLREKMDQLDIKEQDLHESFILGSGKGGQKVQKSRSCVYLKHLPTGIEVKCSKSRQREDNRFFARRDLLEKIEKKLYNKPDLQQEKIRKQKKRRKRRQTQKE